MRALAGTIDYRRLFAVTSNDTAWCFDCEGWVESSADLAHQNTYGHTTEGGLLGE